MQPRIVVVMGERALATLNDLQLPLSRRLEPRLGEIQRLTPSIDALYVPDIDGALDEQRAKQEFWQRVPPARRLVRAAAAVLVQALAPLIQRSPTHLTGGPWKLAWASSRASPPGQVISRTSARSAPASRLSHASGASGRARAGGRVERAPQLRDALLAEVRQHDRVEDDRRDARPWRGQRVLEPLDGAARSTSTGIDGGEVERRAQLREPPQLVRPGVGEEREAGVLGGGVERMRVAAPALDHRGPHVERRARRR